MRVLAPLLGYVLRTGRPKRWWLALLPTVVAVLLGLLARSGGDTADEDFVRSAGVTFAAVLLPLTCLIIADTALGSEIRSGAFALTWLSPAPIWAIVLTRWLGALLIVCAYLVPAIVVAAIVGGAGSVIPAAIGMVVLAASAYLGLFLLIGAVFKRAVAVSLGYVVVFEQALGGALLPIASILPSWVSFGLLAGWTHTGEGERDLPSGGGAITRLVVIAVLGLALTSWRIRRLRASSAD